MRRKTNINELLTELRRGNFPIISAVFLLRTKTTAEFRAIAFLFENKTTAQRGCDKKSENEKDDFGDFH